MTSKFEHAAQTATQAGAAVAGSGWAIFKMGWWDENSAAIVAMAAALGGLCSVLGLIATIYFKARRR